MSTEIYLPQIPESILNCNLPGTTTASWQNAASRAPIEIRPLQEISYHVSPWCASHTKRAFDLVCVIPALVFLSPLLCVVAIAIRLTSTGPVIFCQQRAGRHRKLFTIYKFRTMVANSEAIGPGHTAKDDPRITLIGAFLRRFKLDELPQLFNVFRGDMSLVGPRPKLPHHDHAVFVCRPGVTGAATLAFRDEQRILCEVPPEDLDGFYQAHVVPRKLELDASYMSRATLISDIGVLFATVARLGGHLTHKDLHLATSNATLAQPAQAQTSLRNVRASENLAIQN